MGLVPYLDAGEKYGRLLILEDVAFGKDHAHVLCDCGTEKFTSGPAFCIRYGQTKSCGCSRSIAKQNKPYYVKAGEKYGRLTFLENAKLSVDKVLMVCDCGTEKVIKAVDAHNGHTISCGCYKIENRYRKHGLSTHPLYGTWDSMVRRCTNPKSKGYRNYGGRGIEVCPRWLGPNGLNNFITDMGEKPSPAHSLERTDNDKGYDPDNCCWATIDVQSRNQRRAIRNSDYELLLAENKAMKIRIAELEGLLENPA